MEVEKVVEASIDDHDNPSEMASDGGFLMIEPLELRFAFERRKKISCCLHLSNLTNSHVAFKVMTTNLTNYCVRPNTGIILPQTTCGVTVTMQTQDESPPGMQCKDKFKIQSVLLAPSSDLTCITKNVFKEEEGYFIEECKLPVVFLSTALPLSVESKEANDLPTDNEILDSSEMSTMELFNVEPMEVEFPFRVNQRISSTIQLSNMTKNHVAFKVLTTDPKNYFARPNRGVMVPQSTIDIPVKMKAQKAPPNAQRQDKFFVRSAVVSPTTTDKDINWQTFGNEGPVKIFTLTAVHTVAPQAAFPVAKGSEECSSKREFPSCDKKRSLGGLTSIFGLVVDFFGFTSRSHDGYQKLSGGESDD